MHRLYAYSLAVIAGSLGIAGVALAQTSVGVTGNWHVVATGAAFTSGTLVLQQTNTGVTGSYGQGGKLDGTFKPGTTQLDGNWGDARGNGWLTITFAAD